MTFFIDFLLITTLGYILDLIFGDPPWLYHPICLIGKIISTLEGALLKKEDGDKTKYRKGILLWILTVATTIFIFSAILFLSKKIDYLIYKEYGFNLNSYFIISVYMAYQILASKSLARSSKEVYRALDKNNIEEARRAISMIVGRDTKNLNEEDIIKASVETVAENTSDGIIAPIVFMIMGGPVLAFLYKSVNTLDSMVAYKNERYLFFGRFSAIMDDILNFIPARLTAVLMILASFILRLDTKNAIKIFLRDRLKHASPNSGNTEAVCAGALDIQLAGDTYYFGKKYEKDFIGDPIKKIEKEDILRANKLMYLSGTIAILFIFSLWLLCI